MIRLIFRRLVSLPIVLLGVTLVLFLMSQVMVDPAAALLSDRITPAARQAIEAKLGLDKPLHVQYGLYLQRLIQLDMGTSIRFALPVSQLISGAIWATARLMLAGAVIALLLAIPIGAAAARYRGTWIDGFARGFAMLGLSTPPFYLGIVLILVVGFYLGWFPISGMGQPPDLYHLAMPAFVLGFRDAGSSARVLRANLLDALGEDYVRAARARGLSERAIFFKHAGRNALIPTVTDLGVNFASLGGTVILVEIVFAWPGIGRLLYQGLLYNDYPLIAGTVLVLLTWAVVMNLVVDILYRVIDPRVRGHAALGGTA